MAKLNIVLFEPEIPANTGNIGRTCVATGTRAASDRAAWLPLKRKGIKESRDGLLERSRCDYLH